MYLTYGETTRLIVTAQNPGSGQLKEIDEWTDRHPRLLGSIWQGAFRGPLQLHKDLCALA